MVSRLKSFIVLLTVVTMAFMASAPAVSAQATPTGSGISISPTLSQYTIPAGGSQTLQLTVKNITINSIVAQASIYDFTSDGVSGNAKIITNTGQLSPTSIQPFVVGLSDVPLEVQQQKNITLTLKIPAGTRPGAYYGIIRYKAEPTVALSPQNGQVSLAASVGSVVLITVPGNLTQQVELENLIIYSSGNQGTIFFRKPDHVGVQVKNLGTDFAQPFGVVEIQNITGKVIESYQVNNKVPKGNVLPGSSRIFTNAISKVNSVGRYTVTASISYGNGGSVLVLKQSFWYIPTNVLIIAIVVLVLLILVAYRARRRYKKDVQRSYRRRG